MTPIREFLKKIKVALLTLRAEKLFSRFEDEQAMSYIARIYGVLDAKMPSTSAMLDTNLLCSSIASRLGRYSLAIEAAGVALGQIDNAKRYSEDDKNYLRYYCKLILEFCEAKTNWQTSDSRLIDVTFSSLRINKVKVVLKYSFPITKPAASEQGAAVR